MGGLYNYSTLITGEKDKCFTLKQVHSYEIMGILTMYIITLLTWQRFLDIISNFRVFFIKIKMTTEAD